MAVHVLLITHPGIGEAFKETATILLGEQSLTCVETLPVSWDMPAEEAWSVAHDLCVKRAENNDSVLVLSDLFGATPANISTRLAGLRHTAVVCGLNLSMLLKVLSYRHLPIEEVAEKALCGGIDGIIRPTS